jgi:predicted metal-binding membrane protein
MPALLGGRARPVAVALAGRPDWPLVLVIAVLWTVVVTVHGRPRGSTVHTGHHAGIDVDRPVALGTAAALWALMAVAMMLPTTLPAARHVGLNSLRRRRWRAMTVYVVVYLAVWVAFGIPAVALARMAGTTGVENRWLVAGTLAIAAGWQLTRWKRRALFACRRTVPLPLTGLRADVACARFGVVQASRCIVSCWPLMLVMSVAGPHNLIAMALLTAIVLAEERNVITRRLIAPIAGMLGLAATAVVLIG